ncbi:MAG TPA: glycosyltransferase family 2 protein [Propionibacteriaceae bacterium]|nr:glycosyltransferase family 2 protein [Propionibacteriaceae bacterium]
MRSASVVRLPKPPPLPDQFESGGLPAVSVIIATYNAGPLLAHALDALAAQSLPAHLIEILVVDDGSTDDTWSYLSELKRTRPNIKIFQQPHTGGPSAGRNRALSEATGSYVFFHDADDYLGPDALRRLLAVAQQQDSDIVVGSVSWIGKPDAEPGPRKTTLDADILDAGVWRALTPHKLIRRSLIEHLGLRFYDDMVQGEDQVFIASCLFAARKISILGERDLYNRRLLPDNSNLSRQPQTLSNKRLTTSRMVALVVANTAPGLRRDRLLRRVFVRTLPPALNRPFMLANTTERNEFIKVMQAEVFPYLPHSVLGELGDRQRLRMLTARVGTAEDLVALNRVLSGPLKHGEGDLPTYTLGAHLDRLLDPGDRQVGAPRMPTPPTLCEVSISRRRLTFTVSVDEASASAGRLTLAAWLPGSPDFVDLGPAASHAGSTLTFEISARRFLHDEPASSDGPAAGMTAQRQWVLLLQAERKGKVTAASPIMVPGETLRPAAARPAGRIRGSRIQVGTTPRGSVVVTVKRPRRMPAWHRPRLVV